MVHSFPKWISLKVNVTGFMVFELTYFEAAIQEFRHYAPGIFSWRLEESCWRKTLSENLIDNACVNNLQGNFSAPYRLLFFIIIFLLCLVGRVFTHGPGDLGKIPGRVIPKTLKMVLDTSLLNTQQYIVRIKCKVEQSRERSSDLTYTSV